MKIVVCVKQVPDTAEERRLDASDWTVDRESTEGVINALDEYAVEEALRLKDEAADDTTVTILTIGPDGASGSIRKALSMGADAAVHVVDDTIPGSDALATSAVLAGALRRLEFDLCLLGVESTDARMGVVPAMVSERLDLPILTNAQKLDIAGGTVRVERITDVGHDVVEGELPALVSVCDKINEPRYPSLKGIMAAKKKPLESLSAADTGVTDGLGHAGSHTAVLDVTLAPPRSAGEIVTDAGDGGSKIAAFLADRKLI